MRNRRPHALSLAMIGIACVSISSSARAQEAATTPAVAPELPAVPTDRVALSVSGGISLGSYEAGLNWVLLKLFRDSLDASESDARALYGTRTNLVSMTGASAGNINTLLGALEWCKAPDATHKQQNPVRDNLFFQSWIPIGLDQLLPMGQSCEQYRGAFDKGAKPECDDGLYNEDDGVFSRKAFTGVLQRLSDALAATHYREGCSFPIAVTLTKEEPEAVDGRTHEALDVQTQRFSVLLRAESRQGRLVIVQPGPEGGSSGLVGNRLYLPQDARGVVATHTVLRVITASSAFPAAFGPVELEYCLRDQLVAGRCTQSKKQTARFLDGGVFDNLPIGLALHCLRSLQADPNAKERVLYLDPDRARGSRPPVPVLEPAREDRVGLGRPYWKPARPEPKAEPVETKPARGYAYLSALIARLITVARTYELQSTIRFGDNHDIEIDATSRRSPIFGGYLGAFAGFLAQPFREHDYYVGLYDGLVYVAGRACKQANATPMAQCVADRVRSYVDRLSIADATALYIVDRQLERELALAGLPAPAKRKLAVEPMIEGLDRAIGRAEAMPKLPTFERLMREVKIESDVLDAARLSSLERALFDNRQALLGVIARRVAQRLVDIEEEDNVQQGRLIMAGAQLATEVYFNGREYDTKLYLDPSTIPQRSVNVASFLPHYLTANVISGGLELGYLPSLYFGGHPLGWGVGAPLAPLSWDRRDGADGAAALAGRIGGRFGASLFFVMPTALDRFEVGGFGAVDYDVDDPRARVGVELAIQLLRNHVRASVSYEAEPNDRDTGHWSLRLGISNVNGMLYWLSRFAF